MEIYVMRHGNTVWNEKGITQGRTNNRLSKEGKELTEKVALDNKDLAIDYIITSPLMRTVQTANIMNKYHKAKIVKNNDIIEVDQGIYSGRKYSTLTEEEKELKKTRSAELGMENMKQVYDRVCKFIEHLKQNYFDKKVLVITHNMVAGAIELCGKNVEFDEQIYDSKLFKNAELKKVNIN